MKRIALSAGVLTVGLLAGAGLSVWLRPTPPPAVPSLAVPHPIPGMAGSEIELSPDFALRERYEDMLEAVELEEALEAEEASPSEGSADRVPEPFPEAIRYPLEAKLAPVSMSEVPHELVGAWDNARGTPVRGSLRAFVVVVEPSISDRELENLLRDIRRQHADAGALTVAVYDHPQAATYVRMTDDGVFAARHLVAETKRNDSLRIDSIRLRGRPIDP